MNRTLENIIEEINNLSIQEFNDRINDIIYEFNKQKIDIEFMNIDEISRKLKAIMFDTIKFIDEVQKAGE
ncbi:MAG TPA: hypothetical protein PLI27_03840 [Ignavibacteriales bacterium]|nr:hypothetical protein [Ignavibacteriales bacterium]HPD67195.1 hypothetical protein [Ignavibacteriales bacterium]HRR18733.1 hypothetical protein [Ignavibacteriales bacterium]HRT99945.1 hypothetical protein [Ignavibacteriales bacterium]